MKKEILDKYLNGTCNNQEFEELVRWVREGGLESRAGKERMHKEWEMFSVEESEREERGELLDKIHHKINLQGNGDDKKKRFVRVITWMSRVAALLILPLLGMYVYRSGHGIGLTEKHGEVADSVEIIAPVGSRAVVQLTDGTKVYLNYGSRIKYPRSFTKSSREVILAGEAYFDVAHDSERPFIVKAGQLRIKALGTKFNVQAYPGDGFVGSTLVEGKIVLEREVKGREELVKSLVPEEHVLYHPNTGKWESSKGDISKYIGWKDGKIIFENERLTTVAKRLSRMFNVDIVVSEDVQEYSYTVTFENEPLFLILDLMTEITPIRYEVLKRKKLPDGTFTKQRIIIKKKNT